MLEIGAYLRVSTASQVDEDSLENQEQRIKSYLKTNIKEQYNLTLFCDAGKSGGTIKKRAKLKELMADIEAGDINIFICNDISRAFRSVRDALNFVDLINNNNVKFISVRENLDTRTPQGQFTFTILTAFGELERRMDSVKQLEAYNERSQRGVKAHGKRPYGYTRKDGNLVPDPKQAPVVNEIFQEYLRTGSYTTTARKIEALTNRKWNRCTIATLLKNETYIGQLKMFRQVRKQGQQQKIIKGTWQPIIEEKLFYQVQDTIKKNHDSRHNTVKPEHTESYILSGIAYCGCGKKLVGVSFAKKGIRYAYYYCTEHGRIKKENLESLVVDKVVELLKNNKSLFEQIKKQSASLYERKITYVNKQKGIISNQVKQLEKKKQSLIQTISKVRNQNILNDLNNDLETVYGQLSLAHHAQSFQDKSLKGLAYEEEIDSIKKQFSATSIKTASVFQQRKILAVLFDRIIIEKGKSIKVKLQPVNIAQNQVKRGIPRKLLTP
jgi:DNA invertase Pin-like site-specific DNA recombinase